MEEKTIFPDQAGAVAPQRPLNLIFKKKAFSISRKIAIGRDAGNDIVLSDDPLVSRRHAAIERDGDGRYYLYDSNSRNGTFVNGLRLAKGTKASLAEGDVITLGKTTITVGVEAGN